MGTPMRWFVNSRRVLVLGSIWSEIGIFFGGFRDGWEEVVVDGGTRN